jgi:8-oxo-dGTP pyrophosphatase MutT (NUDIX family)
VTVDSSTIREVTRLDLRFEQKPWPFAEDRRGEIDALFAAQQRKQPGLWNGRILVAHRYALQGDLFEAGFLETDFASFFAWRRWGFPDATMFDCFGAAAVLSSDDAFLLGAMGAHTSNAGRIYFPCGMPDAEDVAGGRVNLDHSIARELYEETGLTMSELTPEPHWTLVARGQHLALFKVARSSLPAAALQARVQDHLAAAHEPELAGVRMVGRANDLDPAIQDFVVDFLRHRWAQPT